VARQQSDPLAPLNHWRSLLHWRRGQPALVSGSTRLLSLPTPLFALVRETSQQRLLCLFNLSAEPQQLDLRDYVPLYPVHGLGFTESDDPQLSLEPWGVLLADLAVPTPSIDQEAP